MSNSSSQPHFLSIAGLFIILTFSWLPAARAQDSKPDASKAEFHLPASGGWNANLVYDNGTTGIWTCGEIDAYQQFGCPDVFGLDDKGHCTILTSYSGKWTPYQTVEDGEWLGALSRVDLDATYDGPELYTGGKKGNLYQIVPHREGGFDARIIARFPAQEIHTIVGGELLGESKGNELLIFTLLGEVYRIDADPQAPHRFRSQKIDQLAGRVREAILLPTDQGKDPWFVAACRQGELLLLKLKKDGLEKQVIAREPMGLGRVARNITKDGKTVLYTTRDDGVVLRFESKTDSDWTREIIYSGPQGPRGIAAGRFDEDANVETVAVFGYSSKVELLSRAPGKPWAVTTIFEDREKGHWLATAELDGRNATDEILASGYTGRIVLISRPPGFGLDKNIPRVKTATESKPSNGSIGVNTTVNVSGALRMAAFGRRTRGERISPLAYGGGFETKTLVYDSFFRTTSDGSLTSALAASWNTTNRGKSWKIALHNNRQFHDGSPVDAESVVISLRRWMGLPEHAWLGSSKRFQSVSATGPNEITIELTEPYALPCDFVAINPCSVVAPAAFDSNGEFNKAAGSGDYKVDNYSNAIGVLHYSKFNKSIAGPKDIELYIFDSTVSESPLDALLQNRVDIIADGWQEAVPRDRYKSFTNDPKWNTFRAPGSSVRYLLFNITTGTTRDANVRRSIACSIDRNVMIQNVENGFAEPLIQLFPKYASGWPAITQPASRLSATDTKLRIIYHPTDTTETRLALEVARQLAEKGFRVDKQPLDDGSYNSATATGAYELRLGMTWGIPYDPFLTLAGKFRRLPGATAVAGDAYVDHPGLTALVDRATAEPHDAERQKIYQEIQTLVFGEMLALPLYIPDRLAIAKNTIRNLQLTPDLYHLDLSALQIVQ